MDINKVKSALKPDTLSQQAYSGKITQRETVTVFAEDGTPIHKDMDIYLSWDTIAKILAMVSDRAGL